MPPATQHVPDATPRPSLVRWTLLSFVYWVVVMGALTPGGVENGLEAGVAPDWGQEAVRLLGAGLLGASVTPPLLWLARRRSASGGRRWPNLALQALAVSLLAPALILVSCVLAAWAFEGRALPAPQAIAAQIRANLLLIVLCLSVLLGAMQIAPRLAEAGKAPREWPQRLTVGERGRLVVVDLAAVDWIETQGNYQALHVGGAVHLLRETSRGLEARLDPARFVRIHRRFIVAADRIRDVQPLSNGDALVRLVDGTELRQARQHHQALRRRLADR